MRRVRIVAILARARGCARAFARALAVLVVAILQLGPGDDASRDASVAALRRLLLFLSRRRLSSRERLGVRDGPFDGHVDILRERLLRRRELRVQDVQRRGKRARRAGSTLGEREWKFEVRLKRKRRSFQTFELRAKTVHECTPASDAVLQRLHARLRGWGGREEVREEVRVGRRGADEGARLGFARDGRGGGGFRRALAPRLCAPRANARARTAPFAR